MHHLNPDPIRSVGLDDVSRPEEFALERWRMLSTGQRCQQVAATAGWISAVADELARRCQSDQRTDRLETVAAELVPLCDAIRWLAKSGPRVLRDRVYGMRGRPIWLWGVHSRVVRQPHGRVLIIGTWNYPLLLTGVQTAQALAAGNQVLLKPAVGTESASELMVDCFHRAGIPQQSLILLDSDPQAARSAMAEGVDLIVLTGSAATGRKVLAQAAETLTPMIAELSGCDAMLVLPGDDRQRTLDAAMFGLNFNAGATCIAPRRLIVEQAMAEELIGQLTARLVTVADHIVHPAAREPAAAAIEQAIEQGAVDRVGRYDREMLRQSGQMAPLLLDQVRATSPIASEDLFAPVMSVIRVGSIQEAAALVNDSPYRLAASVFGPSDAADALAQKLQVGTVTVNDLIAPTADPRLCFGGRGESGFGVTRGAEGLLAMTVPQVLIRRRSRFAPHLSRRKTSDAEILLGALSLKHGRDRKTRLAGLRWLFNSIKTTPRLPADPLQQTRFQQPEQPSCDDSPRNLS